MKDRGLTTDQSYLFETAETAEQKYDRKAKKEKGKAAFGWDVFNQVRHAWSRLSRLVSLKSRCLRLVFSPRLFANVSPKPPLPSAPTRDQDTLYKAYEKP